jgi:hypothetical protein
MFEKEILNFLKKNPNYETYKETYERHNNKPYVSKLVKTYLEDCVFGLLYSAVNKDEPSLAREAALLTEGLENFNINN